jgi:hypothetical protein
MTFNQVLTMIFYILTLLGISEFSRLLINLDSDLEFLMKPLKVLLYVYSVVGIVYYIFVYFAVGTSVAGLRHDLSIFRSTIQASIVASIVTAYPILYRINIATGGKLWNLD